MPDDAVYRPFAQQSWPSVYLFARTTDDPALLFRSLTDHIAAVDPGISVSAVNRLDDVIAESAGQPRFRTVALAGLAGLALMLAAVGLYGVVGYSVAQRTGDMGIRMAIGANSTDIVRMIMSEGMRMATSGVAIGLATAYALGRLLAGFLCGIASSDVMSFALASLIALLLAVILACDCFVVVTATFRLVWVFLVPDIGTRRILHWNVTEHPTAEWTGQQFRSCLTGEEPYRFIVHDHDAVFSPAVDDALRTMHLRELNTPVRMPQANAFCERLIGTAGECLDHCIPLNERHLRRILAEWVLHHNRGRPHASLGRGIPERTPTVSRSADHHIAHGHRVAAKPILGGLHLSTGLSRSRRNFSAEHRHRRLGHT